MSYTFDPAREAAFNRGQSSRNYRDARKLARQAADQYEWARQHARYVNAPWEGNPAKQEALVRSLVSLADTLLDASWAATDRAREYAARARRYEAQAAEQFESYLRLTRYEAEHQTDPCLYSEGKVSSRGACYCASCRLDLAEGTR